MRRGYRQYRDYVVTRCQYGPELPTPCHVRDFYVIDLQIGSQLPSEVCSPMDDENTLIGVVRAGI
jgi:hypothetical protein